MPAIQEILSRFLRERCSIARLKLGSLRLILGAANPPDGAGGGIAMRHTSPDDTARATEEGSLAPEAAASPLQRRQSTGDDDPSQHFGLQRKGPSSHRKGNWRRLGPRWPRLAGLGALAWRHHDRNGRFGTRALPLLAAGSASRNVATCEGSPTSCGDTQGEAHRRWNRRCSNRRITVPSQQVSGVILVRPRACTPWRRASALFT